LYLPRDTQLEGGIGVVTSPWTSVYKRNWNYEGETFVIISVIISVLSDNEFNMLSYCPCSNLAPLTNHMPISRTPA
jgi:hypothetical protein